MRIGIIKFNLGPNGNLKTPSLSRIGSKEKFTYPFASPVVTVMSPQHSSDEVLEETKSDHLRRTNSSSSIVTLGK